MRDGVRMPSLPAKSTRAELSETEVTPMDNVLEMLYALAAIATVVGVIADRVEEYKRRRMEAEDKREAGGHRPL